MRSALKHSEYTAADALRLAVLTLQRARVESASLDARLLLSHVLGVGREQLLFALEGPMTREQAVMYDALIERRAVRQPVAQIIGRREFWNRDFMVTGDTLDPRPDSETLIEAALAQASDRTAALTILDLGTGTGCLLLTLLSEYPNARGIGVDVSEEALAVARQNALRLGLSGRAEFRRSRWCEEVMESFDIIVSNPPYIPSGGIDELAPEVARFEPRLALDGGEDGLACYREIASQVSARLAPGGIGLFELGIGQQQPVQEILTAQGLRTVAVKADLQGIPRCIVFQHNTSTKKAK